VQRLPACVRRRSRLRGITLVVIIAIIIVIIVVFVVLVNF
jgi:hypothetical protein